MQSNGGRPRRGTFRFVHAAHLDLDAPVRGIPPPPAPLRDVLRDAALHAWGALVDVAVEREAAFVVLTGGLFGDVPTVRAIVALRDGLLRLRAHAVQVFIALGSAEASAAVQWPWLADSATVFTANKMSTAYVVRGEHCLAALHGTSGGAVGARQLVRDLHPSDTRLEIGVLPTEPDGAAVAVSPSSAMELLSRSGVDYWALSGSHARSVLHENPWIVCPGTVQGRGLESTEVGPKGCTVVEVEDGRISSVALAELDAVRFVSVELDVTDCADAAALRARLLGELERATGGATDRVVVVEAALSGTIAAGVGRDRLGFADEIAADLRRTCADRVAPVWWARVRDLTLRDERDCPATPGDLRRIVTEQSEALGAPLAGSSFLARTFAPLLRQWDAETDLAAQRELVRDAASLALDALGTTGRR